MKKMIMVLVLMVLGISMSTNAMTVDNDPRILQDGCSFKMVPADDETVDQYAWCIDRDNLFIGLELIGECAKDWIPVPVQNDFPGQWRDLSEYFPDSNNCQDVVSDEDQDWGSVKALYR